jgi:hypothetical protein
MTRPLRVIASEIIQWWPYPDPRAVPFVDRMLATTCADWPADPASRAAVTAFLRYAAGWKGQHKKGRRARAVKAELALALQEAQQEARPS